MAAMRAAVVPAADLRMTSLKHLRPDSTYTFKRSRRCSLSRHQQQARTLAHSDGLRPLREFDLLCIEAAIAGCLAQSVQIALVRAAYRTVPEVPIGRTV